MTDAKQSRGDGSFKLVSFNMRKGKGIRGSRPTMEEIAARLKELEPDLLLCQEVFHAAGGISQSEEIARFLGLCHRYEPNAEYRRGHHGNATFSRFPISRHCNLDISTNPLEHRGLLYTRVHPAPGQVLHLFNTHFGLNQRQRRRQAYLAGVRIKELAGEQEPVILAGDFNDWNGQMDALISAASGLENAMLRLAMEERRTWSTRHPLFALDRVYYGNLHLQEVRVLRERPWVGLSDHFPACLMFQELEVWRLARATKSVLLASVARRGPAQKKGPRPR